MQTTARKRSNTFVDKNDDNVKSYINKINRAKGNIRKGNY